MTPPVLVTGATGFIGSNLTRALRAQGTPVRALVRDPRKLEKVGVEVDEVVTGDITDPESVKQAVAGVEKVYAIAGTFREPNLAPEDYRRINVDAVRNIVEAAAEAGVKRVVHCSTCGIHGPVPPGEVADEDYPLKGTGPYEETKAAGEKLALELGEKLNLEVVVVRPTQVYGPGDTRLLKLFKMTDKDRPLMIGAGQGGYHLVYIDDLVDGFILAGEAEGVAGEAFLVGGAEVPSRNELFAALGKVHGRENQKLRRLPALPMLVAGIACETICRPLGINPPIYRRRVEFFTVNRGFDIGKAQRRLGYEPRVSMEDGLERTAAWYREQGLM
jgi:nucleoside-diphosphate-sugar epimerase